MQVKPVGNGVQEMY
jgi:hypothetical protein